MLIMTTKVDKRKLLIAAAAILAAIAGLIFLGGSETAPTANVSTAPAADTNDARVKFLTDFGWEVNNSPTESGQVRIPEQQTEVFSRYNALQKSQGYDLSQYVGKAVMRYVYKVNNYPNATEPVYATLLVYKNKVIGGDITDTAAKGVIQGFKRVEATVPTTLPTESTVPATT